MRNRSCTALIQVCKYLRFSGVSVPQEYEVGFQRALWTFRFFFCLSACRDAVPPSTACLSPAENLFCIDELLI